MEFHGLGQFASVEHPGGLYGRLAYSNELQPVLNDYFHSNPAKSQVPHDKAAFHCRGPGEDGWVRFAPFPSGRTGGDNAQTEITNRIARARQASGLR